MAKRLVTNYSENSNGDIVTLWWSSFWTEYYDRVIEQIKTGYNEYVIENNWSYIPIKVEINNMWNEDLVAKNHLGINYLTRLPKI